MLANTPIDLSKVANEDIDKEILRVAMIAELDAVNLYEQLAAATDDATLKKVFLDVAREEKTHAGEFQAMLLKADPEQEAELAEGKEEIDELTNE